MSISLLERYEGCLLGLATGDALGTTLEFSDPESPTFRKIKDMVGGGQFKLKPGQWTDDMSMALCSAYSLILKTGFNSFHHMEMFLRWWKEGFLSSTGRCFDIGDTVKFALSDFEKNATIIAHTTQRSNGTLMRLAPIVLAYYETTNITDIIEKGTVITHGDSLCVEASILFADKITQALNGRSKEEILNTTRLVYGKKHDELKGVRSGKFTDLRGTGYVVSALETALWAFKESTNFLDGALLAVNQGNDADTTGAIYGQLAGAFYGAKGIPKKWLNKVFMQDYIRMNAEGLLELNKLLAGF